MPRASRIGTYSADSGQFGASPSEKKQMPTLDLAGTGSGMLHAAQYSALKHRTLLLLRQV
jgi:hypothetical protein